MSLVYEKYEKHIIKKCTTGRYRTLPQFLNTQTSYLDFSKNDYLGLSFREEIIKEAVSAANSYGVGATGSRLLSGNVPLFEEMEKRIAEEKNKEEALLFNSGFQTNLSVLSALLNKTILEKEPLVFFDKLNHASLYQAVTLSNAKLIRYNHCNMNHLASLLEKFAKEDVPKFIVSETLFGMNGDVVPIDDLMKFSGDFNAFLYLDEAHATGILGEKGYGLSTTVDLTDIPCVIMGTFSKALGCSGGYISCDNIIKRFLLNQAQGFIYSTANSPMVIGAIKKAWDIIKTCDKERNHLTFLGNLLRSRLINEGFDIGTSSTHIIPVILKDETKALNISKFLLNNKIIVSCVRPPSVPIGKSCIRFAVCSYHNEKDIEYVIQVFRKL